MMEKHAVIEIPKKNNQLFVGHQLCLMGHLTVDACAKENQFYIN